MQRLNQLHLRIPLDGSAVAHVIRWGYNPGGSDPVVHQHSHFEVCQLGGEGFGIFLADEQEWSIRPGDLFVARPGVLHRIQSGAGSELEIYWVAFSLDVPPGRPLPDLLRTFSSAEQTVAPDAEGQAASLWRVLKTVARKGSYRTIDHVAAALILTAAELLGSGAGPLPGSVTGTSSSGESAFRLAARYIDDNLYRSLGAEELAAYVGISPRHLSRIFKAHAGLSFQDYLIEERLKRARHFLRRSDLPVQEIGERVGYPDVHHFTRLFRERVGLPPATFRKENT